jgi:ABC-type transporter Mla subunit MlaD
MRLPVPGPRDVMSALERGSEQVEALLGAVPRMLALLDQAEALVARASLIVDRVEVVAEAATAEVARVSTVVDAATAEVARVGSVADDAQKQIDRVGSVADDAQKQIDRVGSVADDAQKQIDRVGSVADDAQKQIDRVGSVVGGAAVQADRAAALLDVLEPPLTTLQPTLQTLADTTHPEEVAALVTLVDHLPAVTEQFERDILPVLATLGSVAPDLHDLLDVSRELNEILGKIPGLGRIKRRVEEEDEDNGR